MLPFTHEQFINVFAAYNAAVWPAQAVAYVLGLAALVLVLRSRARSDAPSTAGSSTEHPAAGRPATGHLRADRAVAAVLAALWLWTAVAYHGIAFAKINPAAYGFAVLFAAQAGLFLMAMRRPALRFAGGRGTTAWVGGLLVVYAMVVYPLAGLALGWAPAELPAFGVTPCPLTLFTLGLFLMARPVPRFLLVGPGLWSLIGGSASLLLDVPQDWPLLAGLIVTPLLWRRWRNLRGA